MVDRSGLACSAPVIATPDLAQSPVFRFFDLPPESQTLIYTYTWGDEDREFALSEHPKPNLWASFTGDPLRLPVRNDKPKGLPVWLLVCKQMFQDGLEELSRNCTFMINCHLGKGAEIDDEMTAVTTNKLVLRHIRYLCSPWSLFEWDEGQAFTHDDQGDGQSELLDYRFKFPVPPAELPLHGAQGAFRFKPDHEEIWFKILSENSPRVSEVTAVCTFKDFSMRKSQVVYAEWKRKKEWFATLAYDAEGRGTLLGDPSWRVKLLPMKTSIQKGPSVRPVLIIIWKRDRIA